MTQSLSGEDYEKAVADLHPEFGKAPEERPKESWWSRLWKKKEPEDRFIVKPEWAGRVVSYPYGLLAEYHHRAWALTPQEVEGVRPQMQIFLQEFADRYAPAWLARLASRHQALFDVTAALLFLTWEKYRLVSHEIEAAKPKKLATVEAIRKDGTEQAATEVFSGPENVTCELCGQVFKDAREAGKHLPCPGKPKEPA